jgi:glycine C-acetyltransferase/8-amino-7-oxononanoate synthase
VSEIAARLAELAELGVERRTRLVEGAQGPQITLDGYPVTLLCSNNYLGLAAHPQVREAAAQAAQHLGAGAGASRLISGTMEVHRDLERELAGFHRTQACVLFGSGYLANLGVIGALAGRGDTVFSDELNHASIVDGCRLSRARVIVYRHLDVEHLAWCLRNEHGDGEALIVTDSVFSMDGDLAPLIEIVELARAHGARVVVDEAHALGTVGPGGRGALAEAGLTGEVDALVGTLGKALGSYGAYVCGDEQMVRLLVNVARPLIFSTAPPPPAIAAAAAALALLQREPSLVEQLHAAAGALRAALREQGFMVLADGVHIVPLVVGDSHAAVALCEAALARGVFAQGIRPPTVAEGTARLRLATMTGHTEQQMRAAARALAQAATDCGVDPHTIGEPRMLREPRSAPLPG